MLCILKQMEEEFEYTDNNETRSRRGRQSFNIKIEQLSFLVENDFTVPQISEMLGVSQRTVEPRLSLFGISISGKIKFFY